MKTMIRVISFAGLGLTLIPAFLVFAGVLDWQTHTDLMLAGTVLWFATAPLWMGKRKPHG